MEEEDTSRAEKSVSLSLLKTKMEDFANVRDWGKFHSPRNLLLALVFVKILVFISEIIPLALQFYGFRALFDLLLKKFILSSDLGRKFLFSLCVNVSFLVRDLFIFNVVRNFFLCNFLHLCL